MTSETSPAVAPGERRDASRAAISIAVKSQLIGRTCVAQARDISVDGMLFVQLTEAEAMQAPPPPQSRCWLEFSLPGPSDDIKTCAEVVRQQQRGRYLLVAVRFRTIAPSHRRLIRRYVESPPDGRAMLVPLSCGSR